MKGNHQAHPRHLKKLFEEYCTDYLLEKDVLATAREVGNFKVAETALREMNKAYQRIDSVLDLHITLGGLAIEKVNDFSKYPMWEEIEGEAKNTGL